MNNLFETFAFVSCSEGTAMDIDDAFDISSHEQVDYHFAKVPFAIYSC
jgi:hypothetical protein